jgi:hypothetical protein
MDHILVFRCRVRWLGVLILASGVGPGPTPAAGQGVSPKEAIAVLGQFQRDVAGMGGAVRMPLGPYGIRTRCTWCSKHFIFCIEETTETWDVKVDFTWTRGRLDQVLGEAGQHAGAFSRSYTPTRRWLDDLPRFSAKFDAAASVVVAVQAEIRSGTGPTGQQRQRVTDVLGQLTNDLLISKSQLEEGTRALAAFLQQQNAYRKSIQEAINSSDQSAQAALANLVKESSKHRCQGGLSQKFDEIRGDFTNSMRRISGEFQRVSASSERAEKALATLLGNVVSSQTEMQNVIGLVQAAGNDQLGSFLSKLHLSSAAKQWKDLADQSRASSAARIAMEPTRDEGSEGYEVDADGVLWKSNISEHVEDPMGFGLPSLIGGVIGGGATLVAVARRRSAKSNR